MTIGILFVSTGNVCRAPMAVGVLRSIVDRAGLARAFDIAAAGILDTHLGNPPSLLAIESAARRGYAIANLRARQLTTEDIERYEHPLAMDRTHLVALRDMAPSGLTDRPQMFLKFSPALGARDIIDPYGGTTEDYERTLDLIEAGCAGLLRHLQPLLSRARI